METIKLCEEDAVAFVNNLAKGFDNLSESMQEAQVKFKEASEVYNEVLGENQDLD